MTRAVPALTAAIAGAAVIACNRRPPVLTPNANAVKTVANVGFAGPDNLVYDSTADVYLVSNVGGGGPARDDNGFVSRVAPDGRVLTLKWIAGGRHGVELDSPKGLAIRGDTLAVADIGAVRLFDRRTGRPLRTISVAGQVMNDVAFAPDGSLWITDTGPTRDSTPVDTTRDMDAVWHVRRDGSVHAAARGLWLDRPDGIVVDGRSVLVATFGGNHIKRVWAADRNEPTNVEELPAGRLDGLRRLGDGSLLLTSWDAGAVWHLWEGDEPRQALITGLTSPAGLAVDTRRHQLAVTSMQRNELYLLPLPPLEAQR
jgi:sugar lactone lactonase YvrE